MDLAEQVGNSNIRVDVVKGVEGGVEPLSSNLAPAQLLPPILVEAGEIDLFFGGKGAADGAVHVFTEGADDQEPREQAIFTLQGKDLIKAPSPLVEIGEEVRENPVGIPGKPGGEQQGELTRPS